MTQHKVRSVTWYNDLITAVIITMLFACAMGMIALLSWLATG